MEDKDQEEVVVKAVKELKKSPAKSLPSVMTPNSQDIWLMENLRTHFKELLVAADV